MRQASSTTGDNRAAGQEIPRLLWNTKPRHVPNSSPLNSILSEKNPVRTLG
jgi:hypothetical protein